MKHLKLYCGALFFALSCFSGFAQKAPGEKALAGFSAFKGDGKVFLDWTINAGFSCTDVRVEHSLNGIDFLPVYIYPGICGAIDKEESYSFVHEKPETGRINYYRLDLDFYGLSEIKSVFVVDYGHKGYTIFPVPATRQTVLYFKNPSQTPFSFSVIDMSGKTVYTKENITGNEINFSEADLHHGTYFFTLRSPSDIIKGKIVYR